jgi:phosphatidate cytidylyltransferase
MLRWRVLTALVLVPLVVAGILWLDTPVFAVLSAGLLIPAALELARLANLSSVAARAGVAVALPVLLGAAWWGMEDWIVPVQWAMTAWWVAVTAGLLMRRTALAPVAGPRPWMPVAGLVVLAAAWSSIVALHGAGPQGAHWVLALFCLIWLADTGAYFAGRALGRRKLAPHVSPGKTWAGVVGALVVVVLAAAAVALSGLLGDVAMLPLVGLAALVTVIAVGGDLWESRLKREAGLKDSGQLLPGHGGMLDRIDSLLSAAPVFGLGVRLIGGAA